jgi:hypothetical protein
MSFPGPWRDDASPFWAAGTLAGDGASPHWAPTIGSETNNCYYGVLTATDGGAATSFSDNLDGVGYFTNAEPLIDSEDTSPVGIEQWWQASTGGLTPWHTSWFNILATVSRADGQTVSTGNPSLLPIEVYDPVNETGEYFNPEVVGIEWVTGDPLAQRVRFKILGYSSTGTEGIHFYLHAVPPGSESTTPQAGVEADAITGTWQHVALIEKATDELMRGSEATFDGLGSLGIGLDDAARLRVTALNDAIVDRIAYPVEEFDSTQLGVSYGWEAHLEQQYQPSYRFLYSVPQEPQEPTSEPVTRLWPRKDNRGPMGSGDILYPYPGGGRLVGGYT